MSCDPEWKTTRLAEEPDAAPVRDWTGRDLQPSRFPPAFGTGP